MAASSSTTFELQILTKDEFNALELQYDKGSQNPDAARPLLLGIQYERDGKIFKTALVAFRRLNIICIQESTVSNILSTPQGSVNAPQIPNFDTLIRRHTLKVPVQELSFTAEEAQTLNYPLTKACAAGFIRAFYNGSHDPLDRIRSLGQQVTSESSLLLIYYLSCLKYVTGIKYEDIVSNSDNFQAILDEELVILMAKRSKYRELKEEVRTIPANHICLHAVYGAYVICRPVASKMEFNTWIKRRYAALVSSMQQTPNTNDYFQIQAGGSLINELSASKPLLKRLVYGVIKKQADNPKAATVRTHIKMLTALSEMTTYSMINKVILQGRSIMTLQPLPSQLVKYIKEKEELCLTLHDMGEDPEDIVYIHLIKPNLQCFKSTVYPDLVLTAMTIEKFQDPKARSTIDNYKARIQNATLSELTITQFLKTQGNEVAMGTVTSEEKDLIERYLGIKLDPLIKDAQRVIDIISRQ